MAVLFLVAMSAPGPARAQSDSDELSVIRLHPRVPTIFQLPDTIEQVRVHDGGELRVMFFENKVYVRPWPGTPAGLEALLEVETPTLLRTFRLRVVRRARDAHLDILVLPEKGRPDIERATPLAPPVVVMEPPAAPVEPAASASIPPPAPKPAVPAEQARAIAAGDERDTATSGAPRLALSVHALAGMGTTAFHVMGYQSTNARQSHRAFGVRVAGSPDGTWWAVEGNVTWELPVTPTTHEQIVGGEVHVVEVDGPRLRADVGLRGRFGARLMPTFYGGIGLQAHHLDIAAPEDPTKNERRGDLPFEGVMALGMGLEYRAGDVVLGLDLHVRQAVPANYRSVAGLLSVGFYLDQGE